MTNYRSSNKGTIGLAVSSYPVELHVGVGSIRVIGLGMSLFPVGATGDERLPA